MQPVNVAKGKAESSLRVGLAGLAMEEAAVSDASVSSNVKGVLAEFEAFVKRQKRGQLRCGSGTRSFQRACAEV